MKTRSRSHRFRTFYVRIPWKRVGKKLLLTTLSAFLLFLLLHWLFPLPDRIAYTTLIRDRDGAIINAYLTPDDKWRMRTELHEISPVLRRTIIAKEDKHFYRHPGINPIAIGRAAFNNLTSGRRTSGASTITMQVARALERRERNLGSKLIEAFRACQLEWKYSKDEILQLYLNLVPYGGNIEGVKAAAYLYFQKAPDHLSLAEVTALSIVPNRPSSLVPGRANDAIVQERNVWLRRFAEEGVFTPKEIEDALAEPLTVTRTTVPHRAPHLSYALKKAYGEADVKSTLRSNTQAKVETLTADYSRSLRLQGIKNAAVVVVDNHSREIIAYVGSADFFDTTDGGQVNGAAAVRQPGSTLKPLLYALCMDDGLLTPKMKVDDVPVNYAGFAPENYDQTFNGAVTVEYALEQSLNIPAVRGLRLLGTDRMISALESADFRQVRRDRGKLGLSMILGGCGTTLEELTALFCAFANGGSYAPLKKTVDSTKPYTHQLISKEAAYYTTEILSKISRPDFPLNWSATEHMPKIAWKTGTSYGRRDAWSIGYNKRYTVGVWVGNFSGAGVASMSGAQSATPLLFRIFNTLDYNSSGEWFAAPEGAAWRQVCTESGLPPGALCTHTVLDAYLPAISTTAACQHLQEYKVSADGAHSYCNACAPATGYAKKVYRQLSPELREFYLQTGIAREVVPPHYPDCERIAPGDGPQITSPANGTEYFLSQSDPEQLELKARASADVTRVYWYINDKFFKAAPVGEKLLFMPSEGTVKISCTDDKGRNRNVTVTVKKIDL